MHKIELIVQGKQPVLYIRAKSSMEDLPTVIENSYMKIMNYLHGIGVQPVDLPYVAYYNLSLEHMDVEMGFPVSIVLEAHDDIYSGELSQGKYLSCMYQGPYSQMEVPYTAIMSWLSNNGYESLGIYYETYCNSPQDVADSDLLTKIVIPVKYKTN